MSYSILGNAMDDEVGAIDALVGALEILSGKRRDARRTRRGERVLARAEEHPGRGMAERRAARLLGKESDGEEVAETAPDAVYRYMLNLGRKTVAAGLQDTLEKNAQRWIRIQRLVLSSSALPDFDVTSINIGVELQNASIANAPAEAFRYDAIATSLRGQTAQPGIACAVGVLNNGAAPASIAGTFFGEAMKLG